MRLYLTLSSTSPSPKPARPHSRTSNVGVPLRAPFHLSQCALLLTNCGFTFPASFYYVFVGTTSVSALLIILYFPETKGKSLEAIAVVFGDTVVGAGDDGHVVAEKEKEVEVEHIETTATS